MNELLTLPVSEICPDPSNPRENFPQDELDRLADSIDKVGSVLVPVVVYESEQGYQLLDGERRWRCSKTLGHETIPAIVVAPPTEGERLSQMFAIHQVRERWQDMPTAKALKRLIDETGIEDSTELRELTGLSIEQIKRYRFALELPKELQESIETGEVPLNYYYEVNNNVVKPLEKNRPELFKEFSGNSILSQFLSKRRAGVVGDIVSVRDARFIILKASEDDPDNNQKGPLDETIRQLITDENLSVREAYEDTVMVAVEADKLENRAKSMVSAFERLYKKSDNEEESQRVKDIARDLIEGLQRFIDS